MNLTTAVLTCFSKYATFSGRARRAEFWWFALFNFGVLFTLALIELAAGAPNHWMMGEGNPSPVATLYWLGVLLPSLAVTVRRLHDTDRSGWWILIEFVPFVGPLILLWFVATRGTVGPNRFGPDPFGPQFRTDYEPSSVPRIPRK